MQDTMHIVFSSDANYARYMGVTIFSILRNKSADDRITFHILDGGIAENDRSKLVSMIKNTECSVEFHPMNEAMLADLPIKMGGHHVSIATYYRLFLPRLLDRKRCIYLDCDMIIQDSLKLLWETDLAGCLMAGVKDISAVRNCARLSLETYVNAGMLIMDLEDMRREGIFEKCMDFIRCHPEKIEYHDQDILNCVLEHKILAVEKTWNCMLCKTRSCREEGFYALRHNASIIHFVGHRKPWHRRCKTPGRMLYWQYLQASPWAENPLAHSWHVFRSFLKL